MSSSITFENEKIGYIGITNKDKDRVNQSKILNQTISNPLI